VVPYLEGRGIDTIGVLPQDEALAGVTVQELAEELGADTLTPDASLETGGDRSDIQTTALEASGVATLVLTGGYRPSKAVLGKAASKNVPVLHVRSDTRTTIDRVEAVLRSGRTQRRETIERMATLLEENVDVEGLLQAD